MMIDPDINLLEAYLAGTAALSKEKLDEIEMLWSVDLPYTDDWLMHGYNSAAEWYEVHKESLALLEKEGKLIRQAKAKMKAEDEA